MLSHTATKNVLHAIIVIALVSSFAFLFNLVSSDMHSYAAAPKSIVSVACKDGVNVRASYNVDSARVAGLDNDEAFVITKEKFIKKKSIKPADRWYYASTSKGWVRADNTDSYQVKNVRKGKTTAAVNVRRGAGTSYKILNVYKKGTEVSVVLKAYDSTGKLWYKIQVGDEYCYISGTYIKLAAEEKKPVVTAPTPAEEIDMEAPEAIPTSRAMVYTVDGINVRALPSTDSEILTTVRNNTFFTVAAEKFLKADSFSASNVWYFATEYEGWIRTDNTARFMPNETVESTVLADTNLRVGAGNAFEAIACSEKGQKVQVVSKAFDYEDHLWYKVKVDSAYYYVDSDQVKLGSEIKTSKTNESFLKCLANLEIKMKENRFKYLGSSSLGSYENALATKKKTNCAQYVSWAMQDYGLLPKGKCIYLCKSIKGAGASYIKKSKEVTILYPKKKTKNLSLQPGDICGYQWGSIGANKLHTMVYAGNDSSGNRLWYTMGPSEVASSKTGPVKKSSYDSKTVWVIIRPN